MLQRLYVHNFRCLENFELKLKDISSALLIGKNGSGKSTIGAALEVFQSIGRGVNRVGDLVKWRDFSRGRADIPIRFEVEVLLEEKLYKYELVLELPEGFKGLRVREEILYFGERILYSRKGAEVSLEMRQDNPKFMVDWHLIALSIIQDSPADPLRIFKTWLANIIILAPIPQLMSGESREETLRPTPNVSNFGDWISGLLSRYPAAYNKIFNYVHGVIPDFEQFENEIIAKGARNTVVSFTSGTARLSLDFNQLSDGQKCFFICGMVLATNYHQPSFFFWDEPDNYVSLSEVGHFISELQSSFKNKGQILITSHHEETISRFFDESTFVLDRKSHFEPTLIRRLDGIQVTGDLIDSLICGNIQL